MRSPAKLRLLISASVVAVVGLSFSCGDDASSGLCESNEDCPEGFFCESLVSNHCERSECEAHADCPLQYLCSPEGECFDPYNGEVTTCFPNHPGCPCSEADLYLTIDCPPPEEPAGVDASCHMGLSTCDGERYGPCEDTYRDNCDGIIFGPSDISPNDENSENVTTGVEGELQLDPDERQVDFGYLWIANTGENTVSKIDVETGHEVARYASALSGGGVPSGPIPYPSTDPYSDCQHCPSRTAIDFNGDAYVANRAFGIQGSVTKFANDEVNCPDVNGNGVVDTSWDANDDGYIDVYDPNEFLGQADECILWTSPVGGANAIPRALAIDSGSVPDYGSYGNVWVGLYEEQRAVQLNGDTGEVVASVSLSNGNGSVHPYGAAVDAMGYAWFTAISDGTLAKVDTIGQNLVEIYNKQSGAGCGGAYGISVDVMGRIWLAGWDCNTADRFDPSDNSWATIDFAGLGRGDTTRGISPDLAGTVWVAHTSGYVTRFDANTMTELEAFTIPHHLGPGEAVNNTIGVGIDRNGACWVVSRDDGYTAGTATRINPGGSMDSYPVGLMPYTYSDFTGFGLTTVTRPSGWYNMIVAGCEDHDPNPPDIKTDWRFLTWNELEPVGTNVRMRLKVADTVAELDTAQWYGPYNDPNPGVDLDAEGIPDSNYMLLQVLLSSTDSSVTPSFLGFDLDFVCTEPIIPN